MDLPNEIPVMTLPNTTLFPHALLPLYIFETRYQKMLYDALHSHRMFCVAMQKPGVSREYPSAVGGLGLIRASVHNRDGTSNLILQGVVRVEVGERVRARPYRIHRIRSLNPASRDDVTVDALCAKVLELVAERLNQGFQLPVNLLKQMIEGQTVPGGEDLEDVLSSYAMKQGMNYLSQLHDPGQLADLVSCTLLPGSHERQMILETLDLEDRLKNLIHFLMAEISRNRKKSTP